MRTNIAISALVIIFCCCLIGCDNNQSEEIAQQNIEQYIEEYINKNVGKVVSYKHSPLYILVPLNEDKRPKSDNENKNIDFAEALDVAMDSHLGVTLTLSATGCNSRAIDHIIENDAKFRKLKTGTKESIMVTFVTIQGINNNSLTEEIGICFRLSTELNIAEIYIISGDDEDYIYTRIFGQSSGRFYGAVDCEYRHLKKMYELYGKNLNNEELGIDFRYRYITYLNELFGYERFEYMDDKELAITNCLNKLDSIEDLKALKDKAYEKVKSF